MTEADATPVRMGQIGRHSAIYLAGAVAAKAVGFLLLPLYTRVLTPADYGILQLVELSIEIVSILAGSRLAAGIYHFYHKAADEDGKRLVLSTSFAVMVVAFAVAGLLALALSPWIAEFALGNRRMADLIQIAALALAAQGLHVAPSAMLQLHRRSAAMVSVNLARLSLQVILNLLFLLYFRLGVRGILLSSLIANVVVGVILTGVLLRHTGLHLSRRSASDIVRFGLPLIGTHAAKFFVSYGDRYVLRLSAGTGAVGIYGIAYQFAHLVFTWGASPHRQVWDPTRFEVVKRADRDHVFSRAFVQHNLIQVTLGVGISLLIPEVLRVMTTAPFYPAARWVPVLVLAFVMYSWTYFLNIGMYLRERPDLITRNAWVGAGIAIAGYLALVPTLGGMGAALANLVSYAALAWLTHRDSQRLFYVRYEWAPVVRLFTAGVVTCAVGYLLPPMSLVWSLAVKTALFAGFAITCYHIGVLTPGERDLVRLLVRSPRRGFAILRG